MDISNILKNTDDGVLLNVKLVPNSSFNKIVDYTDDYIRIKISAPPIDCRANNELISFCSKLFYINKSKIEIISGEKSKIKKIIFRYADFAEISKKLIFMLESLQK